MRYAVVAALALFVAHSVQAQDIRVVGIVAIEPSTGAVVVLQDTGAAWPTTWWLSFTSPFAEDRLRRLEGRPVELRGEVVGFPRMHFFEVHGFRPIRR